MIHIHRNTAQAEVNADGAVDKDEEDQSDSDADEASPFSIGQRVGAIFVNGKKRIKFLGSVTQIGATGIYCVFDDDKAKADKEGKKCISRRCESNNAIPFENTFKVGERVLCLWGNRQAQLHQE